MVGGSALIKRAWNRPGGGPELSDSREGQPLRKPTRRGSACEMAVVLGLTLELVACQRQGATSTPAPSTRSRVTFNKDVAPILFEHCATCHRPANPKAGKSPEDQWCFAGAPFSLIEYRDARDHAKQIVDATARRIMPPWLPERGAGEFANARGLRDDQIAILQRGR